MANLCLLSLFVTGTAAACTWPAAFNGSTWLDSDLGSLVFSTSGTLTGFSIKIPSAAFTASNWECADSSTFSSDNRLLIRSASSFNTIGQTFYLYLCMDLTKLTDASYRYYRLAAKEPLTELRDRLHGSTTANLVSNSAACNATTGANGAEFSTLVKQGSESSAYTTCPPELHGHFEYAMEKPNTIECNDTDLNVTDHLDGCTDRTKLTITSTCPTSPVYASGSVYCVAIVTVGTDKFVQLFNPQTAVNDNTTFRFSCMAISTGGVSATVVYNNCSSSMTSTQIASNGSHVIGWKLVLKNVVYCQGGCTWPNAFGNTVWDGTDGTLTFASDTLTGFNVNVSSVDPSVNSVSKWECLSTTYFSTDGILLLKSTQVFKHTNGLHMAYLCLTLKDVSSPDAYYFYRTHAQTPSLNNERIKISQTGSFTTQGQICGDVPPVHEFHYMVKQGKELTSRQFCPPSLLAKMDYNVTSAGGANSCTSSVDDWDVCTNKTEMVFNYSTCATQMLYSSAGKVYCMFNMTATNDYAIVYVEDNQFICVVSNTAGTAASFVGGHCGQTDHTPTSFAKQSGVDVGFTVTMTAKAFLGPTTISTTTIQTTTATAKTTTATAKENSNIIPIIAGVVGGFLALVIVGAVIIYCLKRKRPGTPSADEKSTPPDAVSAGIGSCPVNSINGAFVIEKSTPPDAVSAGIGSRPVSSINGTLNKDALPEMSVEELDNPALKPVHRTNLAPLPNLPNLNTNRIRPMIPPINNHV